MYRGINTITTRGKGGGEATSLCNKVGLVLLNLAQTCAFLVNIGLLVCSQGCT